MPLDHYIPQVYLKNFCSPVLGNYLYAIRKSDLKAFTPSPSSVCAITDGSTNAYLREDRVIEKLLETIEPEYGVALDKLLAGKIDNKCVYKISVLVAYITSCSPGGMRIHSGPLKSVVETTAVMMDARGVLPPPPAEMGGANLTDLLRDGKIEVTIDPKYPQAIGIDVILRQAAMFGNFKWELLHNDFGDSPFFASDYPAAIEKTGDPRILNRIVPLTPACALRIKPDVALSGRRPDFSFTNFGYRSRRIDRKEVAKLNCLIVRCAEETVFYRDNHPWVRPFVVKNRRYRIEPHTHELPTPTGTLMVFTHRIVSRPMPAIEGAEGRG